MLVVADTRYIAEDAIGLIKVEYEPLPAVSDMMDAINSRGDAVLHPERGPNNVAEHRNYVFGPVDQEFAQAAHVIKRHLRWARSGGQPIETAGAVASFDEGSEKFTIYVNGSMYNYIGFTIATALKVASHQVNLVPVDAGGSFGSKLFLHKVAVLCRFGRPRRPGVRSNTSRTASTTSPLATITDPIAPTTSSLRSMPATG